MEKTEERKTEIMNLIGYGLAKFDKAFVLEFGFDSKSAFSRFIVDLGLASTVKAVFNRQDSFDPYFDNGRRGWLQRNQREHIKVFIDSLFGKENVRGFSNIVKMYIQQYDSNIHLTSDSVSPFVLSRFKQLQETGKLAEVFFMQNYQTVVPFQNSVLEDARLWGYGYDFQLQLGNDFILTEVKGIREERGAIRMTQREYEKASEFGNLFYLVVVSRLNSMPRINYIQDPVNNMTLDCREVQSIQKQYISQFITWK
ncbi:MAG TPA: hypothetical protein DIW30_02200 [Bacteroidales bacterium]|nr:hypothetical protein [Bacteroidales bacterium]